MIIGDDLRSAVVFFGIADDTPGKGGINCIGTGFLVKYKDDGYLITAQHVVEDLKDAPFLLRLNRHDGTSQNIHVDQPAWVEHPDPDVDVALTPLIVPNTTSFNVKYIPGEMLTPDEGVSRKLHDIGAFTYTIGLFRLLSGEKRNLPIVHFGTIALMPSDERIPVKEWRAPSPIKTRHVEAYLVQSQSLDGLSGSPVFYRPEALLDGYVDRETQKRFRVVGPKENLKLLGLWQSAWNAPPDDVLALETGRGVRVSLGFGVVVPSARIVELLELPLLQDRRRTLDDRRQQKRGEEAADTE